MGKKELKPQLVRELELEITRAIAKPIDYPTLFELYIFLELKIRQEKTKHYIYYYDKHYNIFKEKFDKCMKYYLK